MVKEEQKLVLNIIDKVESSRTTLQSSFLNKRNKNDDVYNINDVQIKIEDNEEDVTKAINIHSSHQIIVVNTSVVKEEKNESINGEREGNVKQESPNTKLTKKMRKKRAHVIQKRCNSNRNATIAKKILIDIDSINTRTKRKVNDQTLSCDQCLYRSKIRANFQRHQLRHLDSNQIKWHFCVICSYKTKYEDNLKSHSLIHKKPEEIHYFHCTSCDFKCSRKQNLKNHIKSIHMDRENTYKCFECNYATFSKERLTAHARNHSNDIFKCSVCNFITNQEKYLRSHFNGNHSNDVDKPFPCDTCSYRGKNKRELEQHYNRMHNKEKLNSYQCIHCSFSSIYKKNMEYHLLHMHKNSEGFQKFICHHCNKEFLYKSGLKLHIIRCHLNLNDEDYHKCLECRYKSKDLNTLKRHIKRKHGLPKLHCDQCNFSTNRAVSMAAHVKTHNCKNDEDILKCPICPYRIIHMNSFLYHMRTSHEKNLTSQEAFQKYSSTP